MPAALPGAAWTRLFFKTFNRFRVAVVLIYE